MRPSSRTARRLVPLVLLAGIAGGCTHIQTQPGQTIRVEVADVDGRRLTGVECRLGNVRGTWSVVAPGEVRVSTAPSELTVTCLRPGSPDGFARLLASSVSVNPEKLADPGYVNVLFDPVLNPSVAYADRVTVVLGKVVVVDRGSQEKRTPPPAADTPAVTPAAKGPVVRR
jgi:hypothetical protein